VPLSRLTRSAAVAVSATSGSSVPVAPVTWLYLAAGSLGLLSVAVPHDPETVETGVVAMSVVALAVAAVLQPVRHRVGARELSLLLALGSVMASLAILFTGGVPNASATLYTWICLYAFYALSRRAALIHMALIAVGYAVLIAVDPPPFPAAAHWTTTIGTLFGAGLLVGALRDRLDLVLERLGAAARTDVLTGLLNRRGLREQVDAEIRRARRTGRPLSLVILDVDRFKQVNDRLGHVAGDDVLRGLADTLRRGVRAMDTPGRLGGEEFCILLPETHPHEAAALVERLRRALTVELSRPGMVLTASFGVAGWPAHGTTQEELMQSADRALYAAKRSGRDRVVLFEPGETAPIEATGDRTSRRAALVMLAETLDLRDASTSRHSQTVGRYAAAVAERLGLDAEHVERVRLAGVLHDIGKISMPDAVLQKRGPLTPSERALIERHPDLGARMLNGAGLDDLAEWVRCHHERVDGAGYPTGLAGDAIPLEARILGVADAYEAMTTDRPYRSALPPEEARAELRRHAGTQFDPRIVAVFLEREALVAA
jgi:diguanylate cyclase (GGDEF)-like protein/putative nucleotidyltransferase with HDIG domain